MVPSADERRLRSVALLVVGVCLLSTPAVVHAADVGDPDRYRYDAVEVEFDDTRGFGPDASAVGQFDSDVLCLRSRVPSRACLLESGLVNASVRTTAMYGTPDYEYVYAWKGRFFRPVRERRNGTFRYALERVPTRRALRDVSTPLSETSPRIRRAIRGADVVTSDPLSGANELVRADGSYYVVYASSSRVVEGERGTLVRAGQWLLAALGLGCVLRGQRRRVESEVSESRQRR